MYRYPMHSSFLHGKYVFESLFIVPQNPDLARDTYLMAELVHKCLHYVECILPVPHQRSAHPPLSAEALGASHVHVDACYVWQ